jgi:site-specific recombinase XerD
MNANLGNNVRAYFDWLAHERNASPNTILAYRDTVVLFMRYLADSTGQNIDCLAIDANIHDRLTGFLAYLEAERHVAITTRNHRLSALKGFFRFVAYRDPLLAGHCRRVTLIPLKKHETKLLDYLEADEMEAILDSMDRAKPAGRRDHALVLLLYNTGCRASELAGLSRTDVRDSPLAHVEILGKGRRRRVVPLWQRTVNAMDEMLRDRRDEKPPLFLGQRGNALTRAGVAAVVKKYSRLAACPKPELGKRRISPHTVRHTTAVALLRATGDIDATAKILGHASLNTTKIYTDKDRSRLAATLNKVSASLLGSDGPGWSPSDDLLSWLESL